MNKYTPTRTVAVFGSKPCCRIIEQEIKTIAEVMYSNGIRFHTGGRGYIEKIFEDVVLDNYKEESENLKYIYIPAELKVFLPNYDKIKRTGPEVKYLLNAKNYPEAINITYRTHPGKDWLNRSASQMFSTIPYILLDDQLNLPVNFILHLTGQKDPFFNQAKRIADIYDIPIYDLSNPRDINSIERNISNKRYTT